MTIEEVRAYSISITQKLDTAAEANEPKHLVSYMSTALDFIKRIAEDVNATCHITRSTAPFFTVAFYLIFKTLYNRMDERGQEFFKSFVDHAEEMDGCGIGINTLFREESSQ